MRKYFPALSNELSLPSSHCSFRGNRNPCGGGPAGVAQRKEDEEKAAVALGHRIRGGRIEAMGYEDGRTRPSIESDLVDAITSV